MYPDTKSILMNATTVDQLKETVKGVGNYADIVGQAADPSRK